MKIGIVFEGGAFRTIFSCGVMDALIENNVKSDYCIGVSAGAAYGVSYASGQIGRNIKIMTQFRNDSRYFGIKNMLDKENRSIYGLKFAYETVPNDYIPFDYDTYNNWIANGGRFYCAVTNALTGEAEYKLFEQSDTTNEVLKASCALPLFFPMIYIDDTPYMDGGIADSLPFEKAFADGCDKVLLVMTRQEGYRKSESKSAKVMNKAFKDYPKLCEAIINRPKMYNHQLDMMELFEEEGRLMVIRPTKSDGFGRLEGDMNKIMAMYFDGYNQSYEKMDEIKEFFGMK